MFLLESFPLIFKQLCYSMICSWDATFLVQSHFCIFLLRSAFVRSSISFRDIVTLSINCSFCLLSPLKCLPRQPALTPVNDLSFSCDMSIFLPELNAHTPQITHSLQAITLWGEVHRSYHGSQSPSHSAQPVLSQIKNSFPRSGCQEVSYSWPGPRVW